MKENEEEEVLDCNSMGLFGFKEISNSKTPPLTFRLEGRLMGVNIVVLNIKASHNFVSPEVAKTLGLFITETQADVESYVGQQILCVHQREM